MTALFTDTQGSICVILLLSLQSIGRSGRYRQGVEGWSSSSSSCASYRSRRHFTEATSSIIGRSRRLRSQRAEHVETDVGSSVHMPGISTKNQIRLPVESFNSSAKDRSFVSEHNLTTLSLDTADAEAIAPTSAARSATSAVVVDLMNDSTFTFETQPRASTGSRTHKLPYPLVLWKFSRPHTLIGSAIAIPALHVLAAPAWDSVWKIQTLASIIYATIPSLLMNIYITGLNQITDVEIDKVNKPNLVLPAGIMTQRSAVSTILACLATSLAFIVPASFSSCFASSGLAVALVGSATLGTIYSAPPFRWKRYPVLAAVCIVAVRGIVINAGFFAHALSAAYRYPPAITTVPHLIRTDPVCLFTTIFYCVFGMVIALMKDVPDVKGDQMSSILTFSVRRGPETVFEFSRRMLTGVLWIYGGSFLCRSIIAITATTENQYRWWLCSSRAGAAFAALWAGQSVRHHSRSVDPTDSTAVYRYYMHLWKLFYLSYFVLPFTR